MSEDAVLDKGNVAHVGRTASAARTLSGVWLDRRTHTLAIHIAITVCVVSCRQATHIQHMAVKVCRLIICLRAGLYYIDNITDLRPK